METVAENAPLPPVDVIPSSQPEADSDTSNETANTSSSPKDKLLEIPEPTFESDLFKARKEIRTIIGYLNVLMMAHNNAAGSNLADFQKRVSCIGTKLMTALAFYRQTARVLAVRYRTIQEEHQVAISTPSPEYADLERLKTELEQAKVAAQQVVAKDYTVFNDLNLVPLEELIKSRPEIFLDMHRYSTTEQHHRTFLAQIEYEHERRKRVMSEIESLTKKKRVLQDDVRKRRDVMAAVNRDVDDARKHLSVLSEKLGTPSADLDKNLGEMSGPLLRAFHASRELPELEPAAMVIVPVEPAEPEADLVMDVEMAEGAVETPALTPELSSGSAEAAEDVVEVENIAKEEGEASEEENEEAVPRIA
ncbi:hypothetical protein RvY_04074 [Ramazzottius varieornatus]|uniref:Uncharacterized protein n=1 Tax=Ramazzottius varieornatus TaxID=947166 RepID=A0A1D1UXA6_RAMVA|nr:hypothetical protein RvY_04074 [Ramazzottius varieornatus]